RAATEEQQRVHAASRRSSFCQQKAVDVTEMFPAGILGLLKTCDIWGHKFAPWKALKAVVVV
ncbi:MAG: hypothetical protein AAF625_16160, partial [Pseudomonadota bacterium]